MSAKPLEPLTMADIADMLLYNDRDGGRRMKRDEAIRTPLASDEIDKLHWAVYAEINDPGITTEDGQPHGLSFKKWTLIMARLLETVTEQRGQIVRAQGAMDAVYKALWIKPSQDSGKADD